MKQILYTLLCSIMIVGTISCGNSNKKKPASGDLSSKQKKELRQLAKKIKVKLEEKKNRIIKTINTPYGDNSTVYTFDGDKCIGYKETIAFTDAGNSEKNTRRPQRGQRSVAHHEESLRQRQDFELRILAGDNRRDV